MPSDLIRGWTPVRVKKTRQSKNRESRSDSIGTEKALVAEEAEENLRRERLRIERDPLERRGKAVLQSAHDNDAARNTVEFIGSQCFGFDGSEIGHGVSFG